jgi:hypothetical protein
MYQGEVNVAQEELNSFLAVAEDLRVKACCDLTLIKFNGYFRPAFTTIQLAKGGFGSGLGFKARS